KVVPYGVYDIGANLGYVSLGIDHDTGEFAVNAVRCWLDQMGWKLYPGMRRLMITADGGAPMVHGCGSGSWPSNNSRTKPVWSFRFDTIRQGLRSGTRSSIACSATSGRTGAGRHSSAAAASSN